jgi:hypothetical protein
MKKTLFVLIFLTGAAFGQGAPPLTVQEIDGSPKKAGISKIKVSNGTLTISGTTATITTGGGGGSPGGADTQLQYNNAGAFGGISGATSDGTNVVFGSANLRATSPRFGTNILDTNGNVQVSFSLAASAVNNLNFTNAATGVGVTLSAVGTDSDIVLLLSPKGNARIEGTGPLRLSGSGSDLFHTPAGSDVPTKINVPVYDPGNFGQIFAMGIGAVGSTRRVASFLDARTGAHQPTLAVFTPDESNLFGPSWEGSNSEVSMKTTVSDGVIRLQAGDSAPAKLMVIAPGTTYSGAQVGFKSNDAARIPLIVSTTSSPTTDIAQFIINDVNSSGTYAGVSSGGYLFDAGTKRVSSQFDKTNDTTLANVTGLSVNVVASKTYRFEAILYTTSNSGGGVKFAIGGTATATAIIYEAIVHDAAAISAETRATSLGTAVGGVTAVTAANCRLTGTITVNAAGTLTLQFAQNASNGTASSVLVGSTFTVNEIP